MVRTPSLERVEETGRWRFIDVSPEKERQYGQEADREILQQLAGKILPPSHPLAIQVTKIASRIITAANLGEVKGASPSQQLPAQAGGWSVLPPDGSFGHDDTGTAAWDMTPAQREVAARLKQEWEVYVIKDDETPNAFVTGGGKIFVFTGIIPIAENDDGIATVIGHEIAHQVQRHSAEKLSGTKVFSALVILLEILGLDVGLSRLGLTLLMSLPNSRTMESEADNVGLRLMAQACFDPRESVRMWERMSELEKKHGGGGWFNLGGGDFLRTHPANEKRIQALQQWIPNALTVRAASSCALDENRTLGDEFRGFKDVFSQGSNQGRSIWAYVAMVFGLATRNVFKQTAKPFRIAQTITSLSSAVCPRVPTPSFLLYSSAKEETTESAKDGSPSRTYAEEADREVLKEFAGKILPPSDPLVRRITEIASRIITAADLGEVKGAYPSRKPGESSGWWPLLKVPTNKVSEGGRSDTAGGNKAAVQKDLAAHLTQEWEVYVIQDDEIPNAFVTGSGKIFVFTGIVSIAQTDDGLATVIGHGMLRSP
ncbi:hypothetical protein FRB90_011094 [Tulasnella sp. 427]|nr:hypothetical protein FRB90_011094 [Tulasnella sp. 427]